MRILESDELLKSLSADLELVLNSRDLVTLDQIDRTVDALRTHRSLLRLHSTFIRKEIGVLLNSKDVIDVDGTLVSRLEALRDKAELIHGELVTKLKGCSASPEIHQDDGLLEALNENIDAAAELHNTLNDLAWAVGEHDADFDKPVGKRYTSIEEMFADLDS